MQTLIGTIAATDTLDQGRALGVSFTETGGRTHYLVADTCFPHGLDIGFKLRVAANTEAEVAIGVAFDPAPRLGAPKGMVTTIETLRHAGIDFPAKAA